MQYCQQAPKNAELNGLFQCQFQGADATTFVGGVAVGGSGTVPFGMTAPLSPPGSCAANPTGPIADGSQLTDLVDSPGTPTAAGGDDSSAPAASSAAPAPSAPAAPPTCATPADDSGETVTIAASAAPSAIASSAPAAAAPSAAAGAGGFQLQNGEDAQALNAKFATLAAGSTCNGT